MFIILVLGLMILTVSVASGAQSLFVNGQPVSSITLEVGQSCTVEVVSTDGTSYTDYVGFDYGVVLGTFSYQEKKPEAGNLASATVYNVPSFSGYFIVAAGSAPPPSAGVHFVFQYQAQVLGETDLQLYDGIFSLVDSVHITVVHEEMGTGFMYQGRLIDSNSVADGLYDFEFELYDAPSDGNQLGTGTIDINDLDVIDGYFTVVLDFGAVFDGTARWLEIAIRPGASIGAYDTLSPRQETTPAPYAIYAQTAEDANTIDGFESGDFAIRLHTHLGEDITAGTILTDYYSAYDDLFSEGYLGNNTGDVAQNNGIVQRSLNADMLDGLSEGALFRLAQNEAVTGRPAFNGGTSGSTPPFSVDSTYKVRNLNADFLDGLDSSSFSSAAHNHDAQFVNVTGDTMTGKLNVNTTGSSIDVVSNPASGIVYGVKVDADQSATNNNNIYGVYSDVYSDTSSAKTYGTYSYAAGNDYSYGVYGVGRSITRYAYGLYGEATIPRSNNALSSYGVYGKSTTYGTGSAYGAYNEAYHVGTSGTSYGTYSFARVSGPGSAIGISSIGYKYTDGDAYGGYFIGENDDIGDSYGIYTTTTGSGSGTHYAIYAKAKVSGGTTNYAGYFLGTTYISGNVGIGPTTTNPNEKLTVDGALSLGEISAPSASVGYGKVYVKSTDSELYFKNDAGTEYKLTAGGDDFVVGDFLICANDTARGIGATGPYLLKESKIGRGGTLRIKFDLRASHPSYPVYAYIWRNGAPVGTMRSTNSTGYVTFSEDISGWSKGDLVQVFGYTIHSSYVVVVGNLRLYADNPAEAGARL